MADPTLSASGERRLPTPDPWQHLRQFTRARIGLGRAGSSLPTGAWLRFKLDHAMARDAVHQPFDADTVSAEIETLGRPVLRLFSAAHDRATYLRRPDLGRRLEPESARRLTALLLHEAEVDVSVIVSDGSPAKTLSLLKVKVTEGTLSAVAIPPVR